MQWHNPADNFWHKNYTVRFVANCYGGRARYVAEHLPTQHTETAQTRAEAVDKILSWAAKQPGPLPLPDAHVIDIEERRRRFKQKAHDALHSR